MTLERLVFAVPESHACPLCGEEAYGPAAACCATCYEFQTPPSPNEGLRETLATIPPRFSQVGTGWPRLSECVSPPRLIDAALQIVQRAPLPTMVFAGPAGSGKTTLAVTCMREWVTRERGRRAMFTTARALSTARSQWPLGQGEPMLLEDAIKVPLLLIDDLGHESRTLPVRDVTNVIFERWNRELPTWVTTWLETRSEVASHYDDGVTRRLFERPSQLIVLGQVSPQLSVAR